MTPGDAYLWRIGADDLPTSWKMWVKIIPIGGLAFSWENWIILSTGVKIATLHRNGPIRLQLTEVAAAPALAKLEPGEDPFAPLVRHMPAAGGQ